jgi:hypothetical protein
VKRHECRPVLRVGEANWGWRIPGYAASRESRMQARENGGPDIRRSPSPVRRSPYRPPPARALCSDAQPGR